MTILQICEPLFQYICYIERASKQKKQLVYNTTVKKIRKLFEDMENEAYKEHMNYKIYNEIKLPLIFFTDFIIINSNGSISAYWDKNRLAVEYSELTGDKKFFDILEKWLNSQNSIAPHVLTIFYKCICLGFHGIHKKRPEKLYEYIYQINERVIEIQNKNATKKYLNLQNSTVKNIKSVFSRYWTRKKCKSFLITGVALIFTMNVFMLFIASYHTEKLFNDIQVETLTF
jgi:type IV/VI secretion system ImpK/VasF family protein